MSGIGKDLFLSTQREESTKSTLSLKTVAAEIVELNRQNEKIKEYLPQIGETQNKCANLNSEINNIKNDIVVIKDAIEKLSKMISEILG